MRNFLTISGLALTLWGAVACSSQPELSGHLSQTARDADYPKILPLDTLLAMQPAKVDVATLTGDLASRAAALRHRATRLRGPIVDAKTRARMNAALARR